jgi:protein MpaA
MFVVVFGDGCAIRRGTVVPREAQVRDVATHTVSGGRVTLGESVEQRTIDAQVFGHGADAILLLATIHGNESAGTPLLRALAKHLGRSPELLHDRRVVLIPILNPDGYHRRSRYNANGVDLNRNFPASNRRATKRYGKSALSEPESRALAVAIRRFHPDRIVTLHQPVACVDYDGPAEGLARSMAKAGGLRFKRLGAKPGSLGSYAGNMLDIPVVTIELPGSAKRMNEDKLWGRYGPMLIEAIEYGAK